jgi:hypothetical protein
MISGIRDLEQFERHLLALAGVPERAAKRAAPELLKVAEAEYAAGEAPDGTRWDPLKQGGGTPLRALTSGVTSKAEGTAVVITTPEPTKYHQGGYYIHPDAEIGDRLREAQAAVKRHKANADEERLKASRRTVRDLKKKIRTEATHVVARRTLPGRRSMPVPWGRALQQAFEDEMAETMRGVS